MADIITITENLGRVTQLKNWQVSPNLLPLMAVLPSGCCGGKGLIGELG